MFQYCSSEIILVCDHASNALPPSYGSLGLAPKYLDEHIAFDIGAAGITRHISSVLDAPAVLSCYSRLLIDCNRKPGHFTSIPKVSDGIKIPGNQCLDIEETKWRYKAYFLPFHRAVETILEKFSNRGVVPVYVAIHSFTPTMDNYDRPWHIGLLWNKDPRLSKSLNAILSKWPGLIVGDNEPYSGRDPEGYSIHTHGGDRGIPHILIEVRQDLVSDQRGVVFWAERIGQAISAVVMRDGPYGIEYY